MSEEWRCIDDSGYLISNEGRVLSPAGRYLSLRLNTNGYVRVALGANKEAYVHRLVLFAFVGSPPQGYVADHINRNRKDNRVENLRWVSQYDNLLRRIHPVGSARSASKLTEDQVLIIRRGPFYLGRDGELAKKFGVASKTISDARRGKTWTHV